MKGLLITISGIPRSLSDFLPDNGLALLASCLIKNKIDVEILDFNLPSIFDEVYSREIKNFLNKFANKVFIDRKKPNFFDIYKLKKVSEEIEKNKKKYVEKLKETILQIIEKDKISFVGFKLWAGDGFDWAMGIGEYVKKKKPDIKIFGGGPQVDIFEHYIFERGDFFDALCYGEGEETILELCNFVQGKRKLKEIPNLIFKDKGEIIKTERKYISNLDSLPFPIYDHNVYLKIDKKIKVLVLDETRGCENACYFCIHPKKSGKRKEKSIERLIEEIKFYKNKYGVNLFRFAGSSTPGEFLKKFAKKIIENKLFINYVCSGYVDDYKDIDFNFLKISGCESIFWGVESANEKILRDGMNKKVKKEEMEEVLLRCKNAGIFTVTSLIYPAPYENENSREETLKFLLKVKPDSALIQFPGLYPGTMWFKFPERFGFEIEKEGYHLKVMNYKIKALFPPTFWAPLPYKVNGMNFKEFAQQTEKFQKDVMNMGINTSISNEDYLFYKFSGFKDPETFLQYNRIYFYSGDSEQLQLEIEKINKNSERLE
ncbi:MAG: radical SAM protein [bacterium]|nr:radical SAM protein [bacterium]MDW8164546.1 radical SAM protein [Candidatus Omnitrophota bacterium]